LTLTQHQFLSLYLGASDLPHMSQTQDLRVHQPDPGDSSFMSCGGLFAGFSLWEPDADGLIGRLVDTRFAFRDASRASAYHRERLWVNAEGHRLVRGVSGVGEWCTVFGGVRPSILNPDAIFTSYLYLFVVGYTVIKLFAMQSPSLPPGTLTPDHLAPLARRIAARINKQIAAGAEIRPTYENTLGTHQSERAPTAPFGLEVLLAEWGDTAEAQVAYQNAIGSRHLSYPLIAAPQSTTLPPGLRFAAALPPSHVTEMNGALWEMEILGMVHWRGEEAGKAQSSTEKTRDRRHRNAADTFSLGNMLAGQGHATEAREAYQAAIDSGHPDYAPAAQVNLGALLAGQGDVAGARKAYQTAIDSGHPEQAPKAAIDLGALLARQGDVAGARKAYQTAIDSGHSRYAPQAAASLRALLAGQRDTVANHKETGSRHEHSSKVGLMSAARRAFGFLQSKNMQSRRDKRRQ
jgi:tetratricopeptide (TPR) repeat protein